MNDKRGQAAGAAVLLAIIVGLIILFIIIIPPEEREKLIGEDDEDEDIEEGVKKILLQESPGRIIYTKEKEIEKVIPSAHIFTKVGSEVLTEREYLTIKKGTFSSQEEEIYFSIADSERTENVLLDFNIESYKGKLIILLNGKEIFKRETHTIKPLKLPESLFAEENTLTFKVSSPGIAFWRTNQYELKNIKVVADVTDVSAQKSKQFFHISLDESQNIEEAKLRFALSCVPEKMGKVEVEINDHSIFSGFPENCEDIFQYDLPLDIIKAGNNWISFKTDEGDYEIHHTAIQLELERSPHPLYSFEINDKYFDEDEKLKEDYKVVLTLEFADTERKEADIYINGHKISFDTKKIEFSHDIDNHVEPWTNSLKIIPETSFDVSELRVDLKSD